MYSDHTESVHAALAAHTRAAHARLTRHPLLAGLMHPGYPIANYWRVLAAFFHFYRFIEASIQAAHPHLADGFDYAPRRKQGWLLQDMGLAGIDPRELSWRPLREFTPIRIDNAADQVGVLYMIEGATLGGQVISGHIEARLGITPESGGRFFSGYGQQTDSRWSEFLSFAARICCDSAGIDKAAASALGVFERAEAVLDDYALRAVVAPSMTQQSA